MRRLSKHWLILLVCCGLSATSIGISINCSGVFYGPVSESLGILRGSFALHMTIFSLVTALSSFMIPSLMKRISYKKLLIISVSVAVISTYLMGKSSSLIIFYILGAFRGASTSLFSSVPLTIIINNWFVEKHGLATSIVFSFSGVAGTLFSPFLSSCIDRFGWQNTYMIMALLMLMLSLPSIIYPFQLKPEYENMLPLGGNHTEISISDNNNFNFVSVSFVAFLLYGLIIAFLTSFTQHFPGYVTSLGYSTTLGALLVSAGMVGNILFKLIIGVLSDKIGTVKSIIVMMLTVLIGIILLLMGRSNILLIAGAFMFGASYAIGAVGLALLTKYFFESKGYSKVYPSVSFASNMGAALSLSLVGYIYDFFGSYVYAFMAALILLIICFILILYIVKNNSFQGGNYEN